MSTMSSLPPEVEASYATIIDSILAASDINTISAKQIRKGLQQAVHYDLTPQKALINELIISRFDKYNSNKAAANDSSEDRIAVNGHSSDHKRVKREPAQEASPPTSGAYREEDNYENGVSDADLDRPSKSPKKKRKLETVDEDARLAAKLQALENQNARATRGGGPRAAPIKKKRSPLKKSKDFINADEDSDVDSELGSDKKRKVNRSGGFHKPFNLSAALSQLLEGETALSRPEVVKRIWAYVKERGLQNPNDKRYIECDAALKTVFKQDKVHMFTMNKLLSQHLYPQDE